MSLGIVIANIAGPVRQLPAASVGAVTADAVIATPATANAANTPTASPAIAASQPQLGGDFSVVVLQLLNEQGMVTATIPSAQQLAAYRAGTAVPSN